MNPKVDNTYNNRYTCDICKKEGFGFGNNGSPLTSGKVCNTCNEQFVIPERIRRIDE